MDYYNTNVNYISATNSRDNYNYIENIKNDDFALYPDYDNSQTNRDSALDEAIMEIKRSITGEKDDEIFYSILLSQATSENDKRIIQSIINDEKKHNKMLKQLYEELTKTTPPTSTMSRTNNSSTEYLKNLEKALFGELEAVEKYRRIMAVMPDKIKYSMLMEILTDEIKHAIKYNLLITNNIK